MMPSNPAQPLANLLKAQHSGPRWAVTRDVVNVHPEALEDLVAAILEDICLLTDRLMAADGQREPAVDIDLRIAAEQVVVLLGRLLPFVDSIVADLYMTDVSEIECDDRQPIDEEQREARAIELHSLVSKLDEVTSRDVTNRRSRILALLDMAVILAAIHTEAVAVLREILVDALAPAKEFDSR